MYLFIKCITKKPENYCWQGMETFRKKIVGGINIIALKVHKARNFKTLFLLELYFYMEWYPSSVFHDFWRPYGDTFFIIKPLYTIFYYRTYIDNKTITNERKSFTSSIKPQKFLINYLLF